MRLFFSSCVRKAVQERMIETEVRRLEKVELLLQCVIMQLLGRDASPPLELDCRTSLL